MKKNVNANPNGSFILEDPKKGKGRFSGQIDINGIYFKFSSTKQNAPAAYSWRGKVTALDADGNPHNLQGKALSEYNRRHNATGTNLSPPKAEVEVYFSFDICDTGRNALMSECDFVTVAMYNKIMAAARNLLGMCPELSNREGVVIDTNVDSLIRLYQKYGDEFLTSKRLNEHTFKKQNNALRCACARLDNTPLRSIDLKAVERIQNSSMPIHIEKINLLSAFWKYCTKDINICMPPNPFAQFKKTHRNSNRRDSKSIAKSRGTKSFMSPKEEQELNRRIKDTAAKFPGERCIVLMKDAGLDAPVIANGFCWKNVIFDKNDPEKVTFLIKKESGSVRTFMKPCFPFGAIVLREAYELDVQKYGETEVLDHPVLEKKDGKPYQRSEITQLVRNTLKHFGVERVIYAAAGNDQTTAAGNEFLYETYRSKIEQSGYPRNSPQSRYLEERSFDSNDTTSTNYCGYDSPENQRALYGTMRRVPKGTEEPSWKTTTESLKVGSVWMETVKPEDGTKKIVVERTVVLRPGEELKLVSEWGLLGEFRSAPLTESVVGNDNIPLIPYYEIQAIPDLPTTP